MQVNLGVEEEWSGPAVTYLLPGRPPAAGRRQPRITVHHKHHDARERRRPARARSPSSWSQSYAFWKDRFRTVPAYEAEKLRCAELVIDEIGRRRPGFAGRVEVVDVSTPLTRERYTGKPGMGAMQARRPDASMLRALLQGSPRYDHPGLAGFYQAGQWVESPGGITDVGAVRPQRGARALQCQ